MCPLGVSLGSSKVEWLVRDEKVRAGPTGNDAVHKGLKES